jgi:hypothetical protein
MRVSKERVCVSEVMLTAWHAWLPGPAGADDVCHGHCAL